jgi:molybdopterin converting factor small subunit
MNISIKLFATLTGNISREILEQHPGGIRSGVPIEINVPPGSTLNDLLDCLSLPAEQVKIFFVNGIHQELDYQLQPGDQVGLFPPIAGG